MTNYVENKVIIVTGAGGGFGRLISYKAAALGAKLVCSDIDEAGLTETVSTIEESGGTALSMVANVADINDMKDLAAQSIEQHGAIDVIVNNAGTMPLSFFADHEAAIDAWYRCIDVNVKGVLNGIVAVYDQMIRQGRGQVVNISSIYGNFPVVGAAVYGATKTAVNYLSESLRVEGQGKIKVSVIKPTGVPATGLGAGVINDEAVVGVLGQNAQVYMKTMMAVAEGNAEPGQLDPESPAYIALDPSFIADAVVSVINQPWGVSLSDITVRATGDAFIL